MRKKLKFLCTSILFCLCLGMFGQQIKDADQYFNIARDLAFNDEKEAARDSLFNLLRVYPNYTDAAVLLAKLDSWDGDYTKARGQLNKITSKKRNHREAWMAAIRNERYAENFQTALGLTQKAIHYLGEDAELEDIRQNLITILTTTPEIKEQLKKEKRLEERKHTIAVFTGAETFDQIYDPIYRGEVNYQHRSKLGVVIPQVHFSQRLDTVGAQYGLEYYPIISTKWHGYAGYFYSKAAIYPKQTAGVELYREFSKGKEASLGGRYIQFANGGTAFIGTGSFGVYKGNNYLSARPYVALKNDGGIGVSGTLLGRRYFRDGDNFLGARLTYGFDSQLNQFIANDRLLSETLLYLESQRLDLEYQFSNKKGSNLYTIYAGVRRQELAFNSGSFFWGVNAGFRYQIRFK
ncbi:YaiO family outer membrane beta-barrel protein [Flavobacterium sp. ASW18X]|uniref:YaiO family outer membrane beta-barrel protein n=1 Tax=Flavobacterium sp. ASW18X TaxID=2572595 RepID=UPI0010ADD50E|nr:YaiO family outer membrane beta-barrel protein [Flavobacterium sp. ASW18X]TKD66086.1 YaiO family outer membrane beta-barrel protein [Flavobacterium sp. ASW18X]